MNRSAKIRRRGGAQEKAKTRSATNVDEMIGAKIREGRFLRGMSQEQLADKIGVTFQQLQKYENARNRVAASRLYRIAQALELPPRRQRDRPA